MKAFNPSKELKSSKKKFIILIPILIVLVVSIIIIRNLVNYSLADYRIYQELQVINSVVGKFSKGITVTEFVEKLKGSPSIATDDPDNNLRYIGQNPNNYVEFNDELWRIIGVFNTYVCPDSTRGTLDNYSSTCKQEKLLKIIKSDFLPTEMAWNSSNANDWSNASLQKILNGDYFSKSGSYTSTGLSPAAKEMVANVVWTLGGTANYQSSSDGLARHFYGYERGEAVYPGRPKAFVEHVGLMYPSDYGYATGGGATGRNTCLAKEMYNWGGSSECYNNDWLFNSKCSQWTLTPHSGYSGNVLYVHNLGYVRNGSANYEREVRPVVYLKSNIKIFADEMDGSSGNPYNLSFKSIK